MNAQFAELIGFAVGNGYLRKNLRQLSLVTNIVDTDLAQVIADGMNELAALVGKSHANVREVTVNPNPYSSTNCIATGNAYSIDYFMEYAVLHKGAQEKQFTNALISMENPILCAALRGLFSADGNIGKRAIRFDSISKTLIDQVENICASVGIRTSVYVNKQRPRRNQCYTIGIYGTGIETFREHIRFMEGSPKQQKLDGIRTRGRTITAPQRDTARVDNGTEEHGVLLSGGGVAASPSPSVD